MLAFVVIEAVEALGCSTSTTACEVRPSSCFWASSSLVSSPVPTNSGSELTSPDLIIAASPAAVSSSQ